MYSNQWWCRVVCGLHETGGLQHLLAFPAKLVEKDFRILYTSETSTSNNGIRLWNTSILHGFHRCHKGALEDFSHAPGVQRIKPVTEGRVYAAHIRLAVYDRFCHPAFRKWLLDGNLRCSPDIYPIFKHSANIVKWWGWNRCRRIRTNCTWCGGVLHSWCFPSRVWCHFPSVYASHSLPVRNDGAWLRDRWPFQRLRKHWWYDLSSLS